MRTRILTRLLLLAATFVLAPAALAVEPGEEVLGEVIPNAIVVTPELVQAHHAYQLAQLRLQQYRFVELPQQRQLLDGRVRLLESEIQVLKRRLRDYQPFLRVGQYSPVRTAAENVGLALQAAELRLQQLKNERIHLTRYSRQNAQLYQLEVLRTAVRVRQLIDQPAILQGKPAEEILANRQRNRS